MPGAAHAAQAAAKAAASAALPGFNIQALIGQQIQSQIQQAATAAAQAATKGLLGNTLHGQVHSDSYNTSPNKRMASGGLLGQAPSGGPKRQNYDGEGYEAPQSYQTQAYQAHQGHRGGHQGYQGHQPVSTGPRVALDRHGNQRVLSSSVKGSALSRLGARDEYQGGPQNGPGAGGPPHHQAPHGAQNGGAAPFKEERMQEAQSEKDYSAFKNL